MRFLCNGADADNFHEFKRSGVAHLPFQYPPAKGSSGPKSGTWSDNVSVSQVLTAACNRISTKIASRRCHING